MVSLGPRQRDDRDRGRSDMERSDQTLTKLRQMIASGDFNGSGRIPPERSLASELGIGRRSLRRALNILEQEGHISRHQGRGTFISGHPNGEVDSAVASR